jgi:hypothetical protein
MGNGAGRKQQRRDGVNVPDPNNDCWTWKSKLPPV